MLVVLPSVYLAERMEVHPRALVYLQPTDTHTLIKILHNMDLTTIGICARENSYFIKTRFLSINTRNFEGRQVVVYKR